MTKFVRDEPSFTDLCRRLVKPRSPSIPITEWTSARAGKHQCVTILPRQRGWECVDEELWEGYRPPLVILRRPKHHAAAIDLSHRFGHLDPTPVQINASYAQPSQLRPAQTAIRENQNDFASPPSGQGQRFDLKSG